MVSFGPMFDWTYARALPSLTVTEHHWSTRVPDEPLLNSPCGECGMPRPPRYHPYLHCIIWKATKHDPDGVLADYGYVRQAHEDVTP
jgi:hypothetical protein